MHDVSLCCDSGMDYCVFEDLIVFSYIAVSENSRMGGLTLKYEECFSTT